ncbi:MAG TPA: hypothetical protein VMW50_00075 [Dehalococcoidia bacterium]|nr:hypothetical protein [Dehalococcoidia bacterium]
MTKKGRSARNDSLLAMTEEVLDESSTYKNLGEIRCFISIFSMDMLS